MPKDGLEPSRGCPHWILNPARLPIPPLRLVTHCNKHQKNFDRTISTSILKTADPLNNNFRDYIKFVYKYI